MAARDATPPPLPARPSTSHKGDFGRVLIVAGSRDFAGAAALAAWGALRAGAGLVRVALPDAIHPALCSRVLPATWLPLPTTAAGTLAAAGYTPLRDAALASDAVVIGPGLGRIAETASLVRKTVNTLATPLVIDADGLNAFADRTRELERAPPTVITPHPGEFARLAPDLEIADAPARVRGARELARRAGCIVVLKGYRTVIASGSEQFVNRTGNPGMATGGTGDVLAGMIGALLVTCNDALLAARSAVHVHGLAGDLARDALGEISLTAEDLIDHLGQAFRRWQERKRG